MRSITMQQRRAALVARHHLAGDAADVGSVVAALVALHATDPATVHLAVLARSGAAIADVAEAMYVRRELVRWTAMRRTLFVVARDDVPIVQAAVSTPLAASLRRRLLALIDRNGIDPAVDGDTAAWLRRVEEQIDRTLAERGAATGAELRTAVPGLRSTIAARTPSERPQGLTSPLLTLMSAEGGIVRGVRVGSWTTRAHRWEPVTAWWPDGVPRLDPHEARAALAHRWLQQYGPATVEDLQWWTGWNRTDTRGALAVLDVEEVDLHGRSGIGLAGTASGGTTTVAEPVACLLPALDPTPMGWKHRGWFTPVEAAPLYDAAGNIGPTVWWDGEIVGGWASTPTGIRVHLLIDRGRAAEDAILSAADRLERRLEGAVVTPAARTPLERRISS